MPKEKTTSKGGRVVPYRRGFKHPTVKQQIKALGYGPKDTIPRALEADPTSFKPIPACTSEDDWLAQYKEEGQTFDQFRADCPWLASYQRKCRSQTFICGGKSLPQKYPGCSIYILPVGDFESDSSPQFDALIQFTQTFYNIPVKKLSGVEFQQDSGNVYWMENKERREKPQRLKLRSRFDKDSGHLQIQADDALLKLKGIVPDDAICVIALSAYDLYADDPDLFVAGLAAGGLRVAIFSLFRYDPNLSFSPEFWHEFTRDKTYKKEEKSRLILLRSCRLLVHEIAHLLGIDHCINYACCMNGSGHLQEDFRQPMFLCPVDLRKLHTLCGFNIVQRYEAMQKFFKDHGMTEEEKWVEKRIKYIKPRAHFH